MQLQQGKKPVRLISFCASFCVFAISLLAGIFAFGANAGPRVDERSTVESRDAGASPLLFTRIATAPSVAAKAAPIMSSQLSDLQLINASSGVALANGRLVHTDSSGAQWRDISPAADSRLSAVQFLDAQNGWVIDRKYADAFLWRTSDGGNGWQANALPLPAEIGAIQLHFADASRGWLIAREPSSSNFSFARLYATEDSGQTWQELPRPPAMGQLKFATAKRGWLLGGADGRALYQTIDGGRNWQAIAPPQADRAAAASYTDFAMPIAADGTFVLPALSTVERTSGVEQTLTQFELNADGMLRELARARVHANAKHAVRMLNADQSIVLSGDVRAIHSLSRTPTSLDIVVAPNGGVTSASERGDAMWMLSATGECSGKSNCVSAQTLSTIDLDGVARDITPSQAILSSTDSLQKRVVQSTRRGFDACEAQAITTLQAWWTSSPFKDVNFYMGGRNRACAQSRLNAAWITQALSIGWNLMPTWVGYQSPSTICTGCAKFSSNTTTARQQGIDEANLAADAAEALGLTKPNIIYFNLEKYDVETAAEPAFVGGFTERLVARGYVPGMYVHWTNVASFTGLATPLQGVWVARWSGTGGTGPSSVPNPNTITGVSDSIFVNKRIWQHYGDFTQTWGGATIAIDANVANGPVVGPDSATPQSITFGALIDRVINTAAFDLSATASSGLPVTFISATPSICTVSGTRAKLLNVGTCTFRASQAGNSTYAAAANVDQSFQIAQQTQSINFGAIATRVLSVSTFDLNATTSSGLPPAFTSLTTAVCTVNGERLLTVAAGTCSIRASQAGNAKVLAAASVDQSFQVIAQSACSLTVTTGDCDTDGIPNGIESSVTRNASVKDNDIFNVTKLFIMQQYRDFLKREATATEITNWTTEFNASRATRASMIESFYTSASYGAKHAPIARLYLAFFNRAPQFAGQNYWVGQLSTTSLAAIADAFASSGEFITTYGTLDNDDYVRRVYQNTLGRAPTATELSTGVNDLVSGAKTRGSLMTGLSEGATFAAATRNEVNVIMTYNGMLQRKADQGGFDYWLGQLDSAAKTTQGMISGFLASTEYKARFVP